MPKSFNCHLDHSLIKPWQIEVKIIQLSNGGEHFKGVCKFCDKFIKFLGKAELKRISKIKDSLTNRPFHPKKTVHELAEFIAKFNTEFDYKTEDYLKEAESILTFLKY